MFDFKKEFLCTCKKIHNSGLDEFITQNGAVLKIAEYVKKYGGKKPFILADKNTFYAAGKKVCKVLEENKILFSQYVFKNEILKPDEYAVGSAVMHFDYDCDIIVAVGSGVINDIGKILSKITSLPYIIVATAPSMDGYASSGSSMERDGLKITLPSKCANVVIGDIDILKNAPQKMLVSGLGDMLAKYISICEWRISNIITGEYYCDYIAAVVRDALKKCIDNADGLSNGDDEAIKAVFEGLVMSGIAMNYAGISRPASGVEHYFSHVWDMRGLEFGTKTDFHGIQCAVATLYVAKIYEQIKNITPKKEKALLYVENFDYELYSENLKKFLGKGADAMTALEKKERKYDKKAHEKRLEIIIENWDKILKIITEEVPSSEKIKDILVKINAPVSLLEMGIKEDILPQTFHATKDIRDKYVLSRLCWDLGIIDEIKF